MGRILINDLKIPLAFSLIIMIPLFLFWSLKNSSEIFPIALFVQLSFTFVITILSVMLNEQYDNINNGYKFYQILPVKKWNITFIKFSIPVLVVIFLGLVNRGIYSVFSVGNEVLRLSDSITIVFSVFFVLNSGIIIIGIYLFGYAKFIQVISGSLAVFVFGSFIISKFFKFNKATLGDIANSIEKWLLHGNHMIFILSILLLYAGMGFLANLIEKK